MGNGDLLCNGYITSVWDDEKVLERLYPMLVNFKRFESHLKKVKMRDFPCGPMVKDLPCNAGDMCSIPGWGTEIPHATEQRSPRVTTTETAV